MDYAMPRADDFPAIVIGHLETPSPLNQLGLKGVGESGTLPVAAVIASAVEDALGVRVEEMPLTPETLRRLARLEGDRQQARQTLMAR
jgi:carbon-monoxide dehydrogenase large subunit